MSFFPSPSVSFPEKPDRRLVCIREIKMDSGRTIQEWRMEGGYIEIFAKDGGADLSNEEWNEYCAILRMEQYH